MTKLPSKHPCPRCGMPQCEYDEAQQTTACEHCGHEFELKTAADEHAEREHAERSSSQLGSLALCRGYLPKETRKIHWVTAQGNRGHAALDSGDDSDLESDFEGLMVRRARQYSDSLPAASREFQEQRFETIEGRWGFTDRLRIRAKLEKNRVADSDEADLIDWKFVKSKHVVDAEVNLQGKDYVLAIFKDEQFAFLNAIHVHFVETRFGEVTTATFTRADIPRLELEVYAVLSRARDTDRCDFDGSGLTPRYDVCKYCARAGSCPALIGIYDNLARQYDPTGYGNLPPLPKNIHAPAAWTPEVRAQMQTLASVAEEFSKSVRAHNLQAALDDDRNLPAGYEIDWAKGKRYVTDTEALVQVAREFGLSEEDIVDSSNIGWMRLEAKLKQRAKRGQKSKVVEAFTNRLVEVGATERPEPTPKLRKV